MQKDEKVLIKAKLNYLAIVPSLIGTVVIIVLASAGIALLGDLTSETSSQDKAMWNITIILLAIIIAFFVLSLLSTTLSMLATEIAVTNKRVIGKTGIVGVRSTDIHIDKVDSVNISTSFFGRLFKYYTLNIKGSGDGKGIPYNGIINANELKNAINAAIERHAEEARRAQAEQTAAAMNMANKNNADI